MDTVWTLEFQKPEFKLGSIDYFRYDSEQITYPF